MKLAYSSEKILSVLYYGKRARQIKERMGNCQIRTAPRHTPHGRNNLNPFLSMQKLILTTDRVEWMEVICVMNGFLSLLL